MCDLQVFKDCKNGVGSEEMEMSGFWGSLMEC